jgi:hypothetical protein
MGLRAAVTAASRRTGWRTTVALVATALAASLGFALAGDDETVVVPLIAYLGTGGYELAPDGEPSILPCHPPNRPFLGAADDPVLVGRDGDLTVFEGRWLDPSRVRVEPPDDGADPAPFAPPERVAFQLTLPWTGEYRALDVFASPAAREAGAPLLQVDLTAAASAYLERGGREQEGLVCQDAEGWAAQREAVDTDARIDEALERIGADDPR